MAATAIGGWAQKVEARVVWSLPRCGDAAGGRQWSCSLSGLSTVARHRSASLARLCTTGKARVIPPRFRQSRVASVHSRIASASPSHIPRASRFITGMRLGWALCARRVIRHNVKAPRRLLSTQTSPQLDQLSKTTRNIGIIAHIDAVSAHAPSEASMLIL